MVPALKPAVLQTRSKVVAVLATPATFRGQLIKDVVEKFAVPAGVKVMTLTSLELVPCVEAGQQMSPVCLNAVRGVLNEAIHYLFDNQFTLVDSGLAVARQTARILIKNELLCDQTRQNVARIECYVSGNNADALQPVLQNMIPQELTWTLHNLS
ncbi:murI [Acinetobacter baumannii]|nr:murI [Acinetobacter baumannii]